MEQLVQLHLIRFGAFEVNLRSGELRKNGVKIKIQEQPFQVLAILLEKSGEIVTREELQSRLWPADTFLDHDHAINIAIRKIRGALGDSADNPRFIETMARRGYRFIAPTSNSTINGGIVTASDKTPPMKRNGRGASAVFSRQAEPLKAETPKLALAPAAALRERWRMLIFVTGILMIMGFVAYSFRPLLPPPRIVKIQQLTFDGNVESIGSLASDGETLFFDKFVEGRFVVAQVAILGGHAATIPVTFPNGHTHALLLDLVPSRHQLLICSSPTEKTADAAPMWVLPVPGGVLRPLGDLRTTGGARWSPDGNRLAFTRGHDLYLAKRDGTGVRKVATFDGEPADPCWAPDGSRISLDADDPKTGYRYLWELSSDGNGLRRVLPGWNNRDHRNGIWSPDGKYFVFQSRQSTYDPVEIWAMREKWGFWQKGSSEPVQVFLGDKSYTELLFGPEGKKLFALGEIKRGELARYDSATGYLLALLPGLSADCLDFSKDGNWLAYVSLPGMDLNRSNANGSQPVQLTQGPMKAYLPRWSPDGKQIVFMGRFAGKPWKIFLVRSGGGAPQELIPGSGTEADPTWSPDGTQIVYARSEWPQAYKERLRSKLTGIFVLDLKTRQSVEIPDSKHLFSPRWSPDGASIIALELGKNTLQLFDVKTRTWKTLVDDLVGYPVWSRDSKYVYYLLRGFEPYRVRVSDLQVEQVGSTRDARLTGNFPWPWMGLTPQDEPVVVKDTGTEEIYSFDWEAP